MKRTLCQKILHNKKAVSPIIATILMILVVMVGMSLVFAYVTVYADNYKNGIGSSVLESLTIEDIWIKDSTTVQLSLYNTATQANLGTNAGIDITIATIYVNGQALTTNSAGGTIEFNTLVNAGTHQTVIGYYKANPVAFQSGNVYTFKVVTARGSSFASEYKAP